MIFSKNLNKIFAVQCPPPEKTALDAGFKDFKLFGGGGKIGFTLAEVLITLTIIGVIAAITIPNLMKKYENHVLLTQLKNWYSEFSNTIGEFRVQNDNVWEYYNSPVGLSNGLRDKPFIKFLDEKYGDLNKNGNKNIDSTNFWKDKNGILNYKMLNGQYGSGKYPDLYIYFYNAKTYRHKSGAMFGIQFVGYSNICTAWKVVVDVNGSQKGPNIVGRDTFHFYINNNTAKLEPRGQNQNIGYECTHGKVNPPNYSISCNPKSTGSYNANGVACTQRIMQEGWQMNY